MSCFVNEDSFLHGVTSIEENCGKLQKGTVNKKHLLQLADLYSVVDSSASKRSIRRFVITEKASTRQGLLLVESGYYRFHIYTIKLNGR